MPSSYLKPYIWKEQNCWCLRFYTATFKGEYLPRISEHQTLEAALRELHLRYQQRMVVKVGW